MKIRAFFFAPLAGISVLSLWVFLLRKEGDNIAVLMLTIGYGIALFIQLFFAELPLFILSLFIKTTIKTYYYIAITCCYFFTFSLTNMLNISAKNISESLCLFLILFLYATTNTLVYNYLYIKNEISNGYIQ